MELSCKGTKIYYEIHGEGHPMLLIHGWGVDHRLMKGPFESLLSEAEQPYRRIYLDLPGMGQSPSGSNIANSQDVLEILMDFIDQIIGPEPFLLVGESYGGYLSCGLIRELPRRISGAMLLCPCLVPGDRQGNLADFAVLEQDQELLASLCREDREMFQYMTVRQIPEVWKSFQKDVKPGILSADHDFLDNRLDGAFPGQGELLDGPFQRPALILTGKQDGEVGYVDQFKLLEFFPRGSFAVLDMAGHNLQIESVPLFRALVTDWLWRASNQPAPQAWKEKA